MGVQTPRPLRIQCAFGQADDLRFLKCEIGQSLRRPSEFDVGMEEEDRQGATAKGRHVLGMAVLWAPWKNPKTERWEDTFAIITSDPNAKMSEIHNRQAIILEPREYAEWLNESERPPLHLLRILPDEDLVIDPLGPPPTKTPEPPQRGLFY
jgi:putative SOS response-associated peptidase YedK